MQSGGIHWGISTTLLLRSVPTDGRKTAVPGKIAGEGLQGRLGRAGRRGSFVGSQPADRLRQGDEEVRVNTVERARGRWKEILPLLGIEPRILVNKHGPRTRYAAAGIDRGLPS